MRNDEVMTWAPSAAAVAVAWVLTALAGFGAFVADDARGMILLVIAMVTTGILALFGTLARPRLAADNTGLTVRGLTGARHWAWGEVNVRVARTRRFGREGVTLEVDVENAEHPDLVILGRLDLGADPQDVAEALLALRT